MLANCALGSFVTYNLGGCSVSGWRDLDQGRTPVRKPCAALGFSQHTLGWGGFHGSVVPQAAPWLGMAAEQHRQRYQHSSSSSG